MTAYYALHQIVTKDGVKDPGSVLILDDASELLALGAVREATDEEAALASLLAPVETEPVKQEAPSKRDELLARATELGLKPRANATEESLLKLVQDAEATADKADGKVDPDVTDLMNG
jgi:hypothetical protein